LEGHGEEVSELFRVTDPTEAIEFPVEGLMGFGAQDLCLPAGHAFDDGHTRLFQLVPKSAFGLNGGCDLSILAFVFDQLIFDLLVLEF